MGSFKFNYSLNTFLHCEIKRVLECQASLLVFSLVPGDIVTVGKRRHLLYVNYFLFNYNQIGA